MYTMSTNFAKALVWKYDYDVKLRRHKQRTPNTNDHHTPLLTVVMIRSYFATN